MDLTGKVAIVTGGGHGAGAAVAQALAAAGARVCISDLNPDRALKMEQAIIADGGEAMSVPADVANKFQCVTVIESTREKWGQLDILVNGMAVAPKRSIIKMDEWDFQRAFEVNLKGTFFMSQLCGRVMADENGERGGLIVNLATTAGVTEPMADHAAACTANGAIVGFGAECAREYAQFGIRVNTVLQDAHQPQPDKAAETVMHLLSNDGMSISGNLLAPDGSALKWAAS